MISFSIEGARVEPHAAAPTIVFSLRVEAAAEVRIEGAVLQAQVRIEPARRRHAPREQAAMHELFGEPARWATTQRPLAWAETALYLPPFEGACTIDVPIACSYDLELASTKYLQGLADGVVPLLFLFRGTAFRKGAQGLEVAFVPWDREAAFALPLATWRAAIDAFYPGQGYLRVRRDLIDALLARKARQGFSSFDALVSDLLQRAGESP